MIEMQDQYMTGVLLLEEFWEAANEKVGPNEKVGSISYGLDVYLPSTGQKRQQQQQLEIN